MLEFFDAAHHAKPIGHALNLSAAQTAPPVIVQIKGFGHELKIDISIGRKAKVRGVTCLKSFMLPGRLSLDPAYPNILRQTSGYAVGISAAQEGRIGCVEGVEGEVSFLIFILYFIGEIV